MKETLLFLLLACAFCLGGCHNAGPPPAKNEIADALGKPDALVIDVRSASEFADGHVPGAVHLPMSQLNRIATVAPTKDQQLVVHCAAGVRSAKAAEVFVDMGYTNILDAKTPKAVADAMGEPLIK